MRKILTIAAVAAALALIGFGLARRHEVAYGARLDEIGDRQLVVNTTFTGVKRVEGELVFTSDPDLRQGKQTCPT